jgi:hypothetical protein
MAIYVHLAILWLAFFLIVAPRPRSPLIRKGKQLGALTFVVIVIETVHAAGEL